jgi:16S rRNA C967 or C1407 C5-methylase (RsmB/RsmF family)
LDGYYAIPSSFKLQKSKSFQSARIYGQDVSSGAAVAALLSNIHDINIVTDHAYTFAQDAKNALRVLDLCCCPGLKLCAIADSLYKEQKPGDIFGVDISEHRMSICKRIVHKYQIQPSFTQAISKGEDVYDNVQQIRIKLLCNDGKKLATMNCNELNLVFDSTIAYEDEASRMGKRKRMNKSSRAREAKRLKEAASLIAHDNDRNSKLELFDRVLVDAECSTDGSIVHTQKRILRQSVSSDEKCRVNTVPDDTSAADATLGVFDDNQLVELHALQRELAASGFKLLRKGGIMVYSTCSLSDQQNGDIVRWLLNTNPDAKIVPLNFFRDHKYDSIVRTDAVREGSVPGTVQFLPNMNTVGPVENNQLFGGGFYIAKISKDIH